MFGIVTAEINIAYQYSDMNLWAALSEGGGHMRPPGRQLPIYDVYCRTGRIGYMGAYILMIMDGWLIEYFISSSRRKSTGQYSSDTRSTNRI